VPTTATPSSLALSTSAADVPNLTIEVARRQAASYIRLPFEEAKEEPMRAHWTVRARYLALTLGTLGAMIAAGSAGWPKH
jgi:hypothetical protein